MKNYTFYQRDVSEEVELLGNHDVTDPGWRASQTDVSDYQAMLDKIVRLFAWDEVLRNPTEPHATQLYMELKDIVIRYLTLIPDRVLEAMLPEGMKDHRLLEYRLPNDTRITIHAKPDGAGGYLINIGRYQESGE